MTIGILNCSPYSGYDNHLPHEYHFLQRHRKLVTACLDDQVIFYEPGHLGGRQGYFASAKVTKLRWASEKGFGHFYVMLEDFREFPRLVAFISPVGDYYEREAISPNGRLHAQCSVRFPSPQTFDRILVAGGLSPLHADAPTVLAA